jgi:serine/threonine protein kinase
MVSTQAISSDSFERLLSSDSQVGLGGVLGSLGPLDDDSLAQVIELDGRARMRAGKTVELQRYLDAVPDLRSRVVPMDAAIDMALRSLSGGSSPTAEAVQNLQARHPDLAPAIREAAILADSLCSTEVLVAKLGPQRSLELPSEFGAPSADGVQRYVLTELLGTGSQGHVYLATDRLLSEPDRPALVAIKVLSGVVDGPLARERLAEEATKARRIEHPNVVRVLDRGTTADGHDYIVYEYIAGGDLSSFIAEHRLPLPPDQGASLVAQVARGVQSAHASGLVHRDLKPGNIMWDGATAKVADFGVAIRLGSRASPEDLISQGLGLGNVAFMSPEQFRFQENGATIPSDIYSLGGILFYLVTGHLPNGSTLDEICRRHDPTSELGPPSLRVTGRGADRDLDLICRRALARRPEQRHQSAGELADDLNHWLRREPIPWTRPSSARRLRLTIRRHPVASVVIALLTTAVILASGVGANERVNRLVEKARTDARNTGSREQVGRVIGMLDNFRAARAQQQSLSSTVLIEGLLMEWSFGPDYFGTASQVPALWRDRVQLGRNALTPREGLQPGSVQQLMWQSSLAYWLISSGSEDEALTILPRNREAWAAMLKPSDPWLEQLRALEACAVVRREIKSAAAGQSPDKTKLSEAETVLRSERTLFGPNAGAAPGPKYRGPNEGTALHLLVLQTMIDLYSSPLRPDPRLRDQIQARLNEYVSHRKPEPKVGP